MNDSFTARTDAIDEANQALDESKSLGIKWAEAVRDYRIARSVTIVNLEAQGYSKAQAYDHSKYQESVINAEFAMNCAEVMLKSENDRYQLKKLESRHYEDDMKRDWGQQ